MLASPTTIGTVVAALKRHKIPRVVVDPVCATFFSISFGEGSPYSNDRS